MLMYSVWNPAAVVDVWPAEEHWVILVGSLTVVANTAEVQLYVLLQVPAVEPDEFPPQMRAAEDVSAALRMSALVRPEAPDHPRNTQRR